MNFPVSKEEWETYEMEKDKINDQGSQGNENTE